MPTRTIPLYDLEVLVPVDQSVQQAATDAARFRAEFALEPGEIIRGCRLIRHSYIYRDEESALVIRANCDVDVFVVDSAL